MPFAFRRVVGAAAVAIAVASVLAGCVNAPMPVPTIVPTPTGSSTADANTPALPILRPGDSAAANQQFFDYVNSTWYAKHGMSDGKSIIDNLVAAGFRKQDMEVTPDNTAYQAADSIIFSVRVKGQCLVGQVSALGYKGIIGPLLSTNKCLIGTTRPIDW
jgi:hypothetical protein